jgi:hypothetical protein
MSTSNPHPHQEFKKACHNLLKRIPKPAFDQVRSDLALPAIDPDAGIETQLHELEKALDAFMSSRKEFLNGKNQNRKERLKSIASKWYRNSYPFAVTILSIVKEGAAVCPWCELC